MGGLVNNYGNDLILMKLDSSLTGSYVCKANNPLGSVESEAAQVRVQCKSLCFKLNFVPEKSCISNVDILFVKNFEVAIDSLTRVLKNWHSWSFSAPVLTVKYKRI